jgi:hypothetical protein
VQPKINVSRGAKPDKDHFFTQADRKDTMHSSPQKPTDAYASVPCQDYWFWIDNKDLPSKQIFSSLMFVLTLAETGTKAGAPVVTIPTR